MKKLIALFIIYSFFVSTVSSQSLLWKISGNGLEKSSYLYGTIHVGDKRAYNFNDSVFVKIEECEAFANELDMTPENKLKLSSSIYLEDGQTIDQLVSEEDYAFLKKELETKFDLNIDGLKIFNPMSIISMLMMRDAKNEMNTTVDEFLKSYAESKNKKTLGVEPIQLQIDLMKNVPAKYLVDAVKDWDKNKVITEQMIQTYAKEDLDELLEAMLSDDGFKKLEDAFIWNRNKTMADSIDLIVHRHSTFIGIGAGHLPLDGGVIDLLKKKGYDVKPIIAPKTKGLPEIKENESWITVAPEETGFSVKMPSEPELKEFDQPSDLGNLKLKMYIIETPKDKENSGYTVAIIDYPIENINSQTMTPEELDTYYENSLMGGANGVEGKVLDRGEILLDSYVAKTMDVDAYNGSFNIRFVTLLRNNRLFLLQVLTQKSLENNKGLEKFLNSFKLVDYDLENLTSSKQEVREWKLFESKKGRFSILMDGEPNLWPEPIKTDIGDLTMNFAMLESKDENGNDIVKSVIYTDYPSSSLNSDSMNLEELKDFYLKDSDDPIEGKEGKMVKKDFIQIDNTLVFFSDYYFYLEGLKYNFTTHTILIKNRMYILQYITLNENHNLEETNKFLNSFKILKE